MDTKTDEKNVALFIDFDNIALGLKQSPVKKFDISLMLERLLEKGKIVIKRAYADWSNYTEYKRELHSAGIELIEIPKRQIAGKNSADIRLVVDAMDLCYAKEHIDIFAIASGDSDFAPLVSKLRENNKSAIGIGIRNSSSELLINNCDEFIFYDDLARDAKPTPSMEAIPKEKAPVFRFLVETIRALIRENKEILYSSMIKDMMKRKQPSFDEGRSGYATFGDLLEDAQKYGILEVTRDSKAGGTYVVTALGPKDSGRGRARV